MESFYVLEGEITLYLGERSGARAPAGSFAHILGGTIDGFRVESDEARYLILTTPRRGLFYRAITLASRPGRLPPLDWVEGSQIKRASKDYGVEFVGPLPDPIDSKDLATTAFRASATPGDELSGRPPSHTL
jgi:hypothetical protein